MPEIKKRFVTWEELGQLLSGVFPSSAHTHIKTEITDFDHASEHEVGGGDLLAFADITGFGTYLDQAVKEASNVIHASILVNNTGLHVKDTDASHYLIIKPGSDITANRTLSFVTGDAARTITLSGNPTLADWFDQGVKQASHVKHASITVGNTGLHILDTNASHDLIIKPGSDLTADRILTLITGNTARTITLSGNPTLDDWFNQAVKTSSNVEFNDLITRGNVYIDTDTGNKAFYVTRLGTIDQSLKIYVDDAIVYFLSEQDEGEAGTYGSFVFSMDDDEAQTPYFQIKLKSGAQLFKVDHLGDAIFATAKLTDLTDSYVPYHVSDAAGLANSPIRISGTDVGIGIVPTEKLHVNGIVKADNFYLAVGVTPTLKWLSDVNTDVELNGQIISHWNGEWLNRWGYETDLPPIAYMLRTEFVGYANDSAPPWTGLAVGTGTMAGVAATANHPGIVKFTSSAVINNGYRFMTEVDAFVITGGEVSEFVFQLKRLGTTRVKMGFKDTFGWTDPTDGVWLDIRFTDPYPCTLTGKTANNGVISTTGGSKVLAINTWYRARLQVNSAATEVMFYLYDMDGLLLWNNDGVALKTNIPTARTTGHGITATHDAAAAYDLIWVDFMTAVSIGTLQRGN